jgi:uncharacterized repeat protein (TIGR01451 family)
MKQLVTLLGLIALVAIPSRILAQHLPHAPTHGYSPLLYVQFVAPRGMQVTFYQGWAPPRLFTAPVTVAVRPGYAYRVKLSNIQDHPGLNLYPTVEVYGTLQLPPTQRTSDYPAPVAFSDLDIRQAAASSMLTKVIYLEDPEKAVPTATLPGEPPLESEVPPTRDPWVEARELGRPVAVVRVGGRQLSEEELAAQSVPGTILFPGEPALGAPAVGPWMPWNCIPFYDPRLGPRPPYEECMHDGGDVGTPAGLDRNGHVQGLDPSDTVAEYTDNAGRRHLAISNRICLCVPRFAVLRKELPLVQLDTALAPGGLENVQTQVQLNVRVPSVTILQNEQLRGLLGKERPSGAINTEGVGSLIRVEILQGYFLELGPAAAICTKWAQQLTELEIARLVQKMELAQTFSKSVALQGVEQVEGTAVIGRIEKLEIVGTVLQTRDFTCLCHGEPKIPEKPLVLCKWADAQSAKIGDVVTFYLKYGNLGGQPINDVAVSDSLTGRLEYIPGSARSDRNAVFTLQPNEAGSLILRWEVSGSLLPGQSGVVSFQARIR